MISVRKDVVFVWLPLLMEDGSFAWLSFVEREVDDNPVFYLGLFEIITYKRLG